MWKCLCGAFYGFKPHIPAETLMDLLKEGVTEFEWKKMPCLIETKPSSPGTHSVCETEWQPSHTELSMSRAYTALSVRLKYISVNKKLLLWRSTSLSCGGSPSILLNRLILLDTFSKNSISDSLSSWYLITPYYVLLMN